MESSNDYQSIAIAPDGTPWVSAHNTGGYLTVMKYVGSGGTGCLVTTWTCTTIDSSSADMGMNTSLGFDPSGSAWISYFDNVNDNLRLARYVGSGGNCTSPAWKCTSIDSANDVGEYTNLAFGPDGTAWISYVYKTSNDLRVANLNRGGELQPSASTNISNGAAITKSHADMTSATDTANQGDADCITGTWTNGKAYTTSEGALSIPANYCTEVSFGVDTAKAQDNTTYRMLVATGDPTYGAKRYWRGPSTISQYPTLMLASSTTLRVSKDALSDDGSSCDDTNWTCTTLSSTAGTGLTNAVAVDGNGTPMVVYEDQNGARMMYATYAGTGNGNGCTAGAWTCGVLDSTTATFGTTSAFAGGASTSMITGDDGTVWAAWTGATSITASSAKTYLRIARYVGTGGSGCGTGTAWVCTSIDTYGVAGVANATGLLPSLALDSSGVPWISYFDNVALTLKLAHYVGGGGTGCVTSAWTCTTIVSASDTAFASGGSTPRGSSGLVFDNLGRPVIVYTKNSTAGVYTATYVGGGGTGCTSLAWTCAALDNPTTGGTRWVTVGSDGNGTIWAAYQDTGHNTQVVAKYLNGGSASTCSASTAWDCYVVDNGTTGRYQRMAIDNTGAPWIVSKDDDDNMRRVARYVGSGGTGCQTTAWTCTTLSGGSGTNYSSWGSIAFDKSGVPWVSQYQQSSGVITISNLRLPPSPPVGARSVTQGSGGGVNGSTGDLRYRLDSGTSPRPTSCQSATNLKGYCGIASSDTYYDQVSALQNQTPMYDFAVRSSSNSSTPSYKWVGQSNTATSSRAATLQIYRFGTTNAWVTITTNTNTSANTDFTMGGSPSAGSTSEYWQADGSNYWTYYRVYQASAGANISFKTNYFGALTNTAPYAPSSLAQYKSNGSTSIATNGYTNETSVVLKGTVSDFESNNTALCVDYGSALASPTLPSTCGSLAASGATASVTVTGLTSGTTYKWQAKSQDSNSAYSSSYTQFNSGNAAFTVDTVSPTTGSVYDGSTAGVDGGFNSGSLSSLSCNWSGFADALSGIGSYDYSIGTTAGGTDILTWTNVSSGTTSVTPTGLTLRTSVVYYCNVTANDIAGNTSSVVSSNGQVAGPTLTFSVSSSTLSFADLNALNNYTDSQSLTLATSTNGYGGYSISQYGTPLTSGANTVAAFNGGTYAAPDSWQSGDAGFGYTSSDTSVGGSNKFQSTTCPGGSALVAPGCFAPVAAAASGDIVADHASGVTGTSIANEQFTLTYRLSVPATQAAGRYSGSIVFTCVAAY